MRRVGWLTYLAGTLLASAACRQVPAELSLEQLPTPDRPAPVERETQLPWYGDLELRPRESDQARPAPESSKKAETKADVRAKRHDEFWAPLPEPTAEELAAWDRKDPVGEQSLYEWDKANLATMSKRWRELECMHLAVVSFGNATYNMHAPTQWDRFVQDFVPMSDAWFRHLLDPNPEILTKSKFIGWILEGHELLISSYPIGYVERDEWALKRMDALWVVNANRSAGYAEKLGGQLELLDPTDADAVAACRVFLDTL